MKVCITIDMEHDCPPYMTTYRGVEEGTPRLLALFAEEGIAATFFTTGDVARRYPQVVERIVKEGHELGCHGDTHRRFSTLDRQEAQREIHDASEVLRQHYPVTSFRAPNLDFPAAYLDLLVADGYQVDSSQGRHKQASLLTKPSRWGGLSRVPASIAPSAMRLPRLVRDTLCTFMESPVVLFFHPWEFVDMTRAPMPLDCRFKTGEPAIACLRDNIRFFKRRDGEFHRMREMAA